MPDDSDDSIIFLDDSPVRNEVGTLQNRAETREFQIATSSRDSDDVVRESSDVVMATPEFEHQGQGSAQNHQPEPISTSFDLWNADFNLTDENLKSPAPKPLAESPKNDPVNLENKRKRASYSQPSRDSPENSLKTSSDDLVLTPRKRPKHTTIVEDFHGVYCLISRSPLKQYKNRCYIGYTVDPGRRINQHNAGRDKGGAKKTENRGPWDMVCVVHGFPNNITALRFEWAWQNPTDSKAIRDLNLKKEKKETPFAFRLRIACHLMNAHPWKNFALVFRWLIPSEEIPFPKDVLPPRQTQIGYGKVEKVQTKIDLNNTAKFWPLRCCHICKLRIEKIEQVSRCPSQKCLDQFHIKCLADYTLKRENEPNKLVPFKGTCPKCTTAFHWRDIVRDKRFILENKDRLFILGQRCENRKFYDQKLAHRLKAASDPAENLMIS
ncbi:hypothetical protein WR25_08266 [Diploscapter pachys]|uniref:Structure-specific endonuclease subunit SLX1 homolog n=1 Tax=Diploscapter pachys TaxID=2018661 RepID=A0A2A2LHP4_9BILA|nr:hypothetical protein WR25_08266 [Diploscapter pachys]